MAIPKLLMVFDVESIGLHGDGYDVGFVVVGADGHEVASGRHSCPPDAAHGDPDDRRWVRENVPPPSVFDCRNPHDVLNAFWADWQEWKAKGAVLVADCCWPVEARFLAACVDDDPVKRKWEGPYPLHDVATARLAVGLDPLATVDRMPGELPAHDPLADARQSARLWIEALRKVEAH